jgi:predicted outer membrane repeat protein
MPAPASTLHVPSEYATINAAMHESSPGDTVLVAPGVYTDYETINWFGVEIASCAFVASGVTLLSEAGPEQTVIDLSDWGDAVGVYTVLVLNLGEPVLVSGFTITGTTTFHTEVYIQDSAGATVRSCVFSGAEAGAGGAIVCSGTPLTIESCRFENCSAEERGGAVFLQDEALVVRDCEFVECHGRSGGAVYLDGDAGGALATVLVEDCVFIGNSAEINGGAVRCAQVDEVVLTDCYFEGNWAGTPGGGGNHNGGAVEMGAIVGLVERCTFVRNRVYGSQASGGGWSGTGSLRENTFFGCETEEVGGPAAVDFAGVAGSSFENNVVAGSRGGPALEGQVYFARSCNVYWDNEFGVGYPLEPTEIEANPLFCDPVTNDFTVHENSPCLPAHSNGCGQIGAWGQGCGVVSVDARSWGSIKAAYRGEEAR